MQFSRAIGASLTLASLAFACGSFGSSEDPAPQPPADGGTCAAIFVGQQAGDDARQGCEQTAPMKTIAAAISRAKAIGVHEVRVCSATYDEQALLLDAPISLHGGYDCASWQKTGAETRVTRTGTSSDAVTLTVGSAAVTHDVEIDGFAIEGPSEGTTGTAVAVKDGAKPYMHDLNVTGGGTAATSTAAGATGMAISNGAAPEVTHSTISGGRGIVPAGAAQAGAVGVSVLASSPWLHDLTIDASKTPTGAEGLHVGADTTLTGGNALSKVRVTWSSGKNTVIGINVAGPNTKVELVDSTIDMTDIACETENKMCATVGIFVAAADLTVRRSKLIGNNVPAGTGGSVVTGLGAIQSTISIENSLFFGGNDQATTGVTANAIDLTTCPNAKIIHNTIVTGPSPAAIAVKVHGKSTGALIDGNLLASATGPLLSLAACDESTIASFHGNAIIGAKPTIVIIQTACDGSMANGADAVVGAESVLGLSGDQGNRRFGLSCGAEVRCSPLNCLGGDCTNAIFTGGATRGTLAADGWKLRDDVSCLLAKSEDESDSGQSLMDDFYGTKRVTPFSVGAIESEACTP